MGSNIITKLIDKLPIFKKVNLNIGPKKKIFCILAETGGGKDTIAEFVLNKYNDILDPVISYTTRPKRDDETEGVEHYFRTPDEFHDLMEKNKDNILAYTKIASKEVPDGYEYMALVDDDKTKSMLYIIDPQGLHYLKRKFKDKYDIISIYVYAPLDQRRERARSSRSDFNTEFERRVLAESLQFDEFRNKKKYDYIVYNFNHFLRSAIKMVEAIVSYEISKDI